MSTRLVTIGGSEIGAVCGIDPYTSPTELAARKLGLIPEREETQAMRLGKLLEPLIFQLASERREVTPGNDETLRDPMRKWVVGTPDAFTAVNGVRVPLEAKAVGAFTHWNGAPPLHYQAQCQWYMYLLDAPYAVICALIGGQRYDEFLIERDDSAIDTMLTFAEAFVRMLRRGKLPEPDGSDSARATLLQLYPEHVPAKLARGGKACVEAHHQLRLIREAEEKLKEQRQRNEATLKDAMGDAETLIGPHDQELAHWRTVRSGRVDTTALKAARPDVAGEFTTYTTTRRFTLA